MVSVLRVYGSLGDSHSTNGRRKGIRDVASQTPRHHRQQQMLPVASWRVVKPRLFLLDGESIRRFKLEQVGVQTLVPAKLLEHHQRRLVLAVGRALDGDADRQAILDVYPQFGGLARGRAQAHEDLRLLEP